MSQLCEKTAKHPRNSRQTTTSLHARVLHHPAKFDFSKRRKHLIMPPTNPEGIVIFRKTITVF